MTIPAAFKAAYADLKVVKTRQVCQIICELPLGEMQAFVAAFGAPNPAEEVWVAIARLDPSSSGRTPGFESMNRGSNPREGTKEKRRFAELPIAQQAALLCNREAFWKFLSDEKGYAEAQNKDDAADALRSWCGISSRAELATNARAAGLFQTLTHEFERWMNEVLQ